ncbi:amidase signature enzyme [Hypoxylon sp. FL1284]|nr:amidase signature enzyme [Hypoxylon sp. FL1284]
MTDVREITIAQVHESFKNGTLTASELAVTYLDRIARCDKSGPRINSTMALSPTAVEEASMLDVYLKEHGKLRGRLHGIPVLIKDQADTKGMVTTYGSAVAKNNIPDEDAFVVTKLKEAGAVVLGKTTTAEWASVWFSCNGATDYEFTKNPYNLGHDVGASSSGSGAAVAANFTILAVGEDTGGSIRVPSSFNNIVGLRPTPGLISRTGFCPLIKVQDTPGPMARTVTDCALMLDCMVGFDPRDDFTGFAATAAALGLPKGGSYAAHLEDGIAKIKGAKIGVVRQKFGPDSDPHCRATNEVVNAAIDKLRTAGTTFVDVHIENLDHYMKFPLTYLQQSRSDINSFLATKPDLPPDLADIVPATSDKPYMKTTCDMAHGPLDPRSDPSYVDRILQRGEFRRAVDCVFASLGLDALALPDVRVPPPPLEDAMSGRFMGDDGVEDFPTNTFFASVTLHPAISVPAGFTSDGLPVGMELIALEHQEQSLLELAYGVESIVGARKAPPGLI